MNADWKCLTPNRDGSVSEEEAEMTILLLTEARRSDLDSGPWTQKALKERIAKREAREMAFHMTSRWLKRLETEDPAILFPSEPDSPEGVHGHEEP